MGEVVRFFHGILAPIGCVSVMRPERCPVQSACRFRHLFKEIRDHTARLLDRATLADVHAGWTGVPSVDDRPPRLPGRALSGRVPGSKGRH
jgi:DNA-binding IscR family transcriptional regulator